MKVLVVGGTRFIGAHLVRRLAERHIDVTVFHRGTSLNPILPPVRHIRHPSAHYPITGFPAEVTSGTWDVVVHMVMMGAADARSAVETFAGRSGRLVMVSSCDVYRAYGRLTGAEPGEPDPTPLDEEAPLRSSRFPYRGQEASLGDFATNYDKILAEQVVSDARNLNWSIIRLPKVYGPEDNGDLATIYGFAQAPAWRWTHGHVANIAAAIDCVAEHPKAERRIFNAGEAHTPTMAERLAALPPKDISASLPPFDFRQDLVLETLRLRDELGFADVMNEAEAMLALAKHHGA